MAKFRVILPTGSVELENCETGECLTLSASGGPLILGTVEMTLVLSPTPESSSRTKPADAATPVQACSAEEARASVDAVSGAAPAVAPVVTPVVAMASSAVSPAATPVEPPLRSVPTAYVFEPEPELETKSGSDSGAAFDEPEKEPSGRFNEAVDDGRPPFDILSIEPAPGEMPPVFADAEMNSRLSSLVGLATGGPAAGAPASEDVEDEEDPIEGMIRTPAPGWATQGHGAPDPLASVPVFDPAPDVPSVVHPSHAAGAAPAREPMRVLDAPLEALTDEDFEKTLESLANRRNNMEGEIEYLEEIEADPGTVEEIVREIDELDDLIGLVIKRKEAFEGQPPRIGGYGL